MSKTRLMVSFGCILNGSHHISREELQIDDIHNGHDLKGPERNNFPKQHSPIHIYSEVSSIEFNVTYPHMNVYRISPIVAYEKEHMHRS